MERKVLPSYDTRIVDEEKGIVDHLFSVYGVIDEALDRVHPGAFSKTVQERGGKVKILDAHNSRSVLSVLGKPIAFREIGRDALPATLLAQYPEATGGMVATVQYFLDTPEGKGAFIRIREGGVDESSFAYDVIKKSYTETEYKGKPVRVRELHELRLYDISPVVYGMNPATAVLGAKSSEEEKRWRVVSEGGKWCVYQLNGDVLSDEPEHCFDTEEEAEDYMRALYANMPEEERLDPKARWTRAYINDLPDSAFLYVEPGHEKDEEGKTVPRSARHFPYRNADGEIDIPHLRNAIARIPQSNAPGLDDEKKEELQARARRLLEEVQRSKALLEKMEIMETRLETVYQEIKRLADGLAQKNQPDETESKDAPSLIPDRKALIEEIFAMMEK